MLVSLYPSSAARICQTCTNMPQSTGQCRRCQLGWKKKRNRYVFFISGRLLLEYYGSVFVPMGAAMLPAQACAKWPPCLLFRAHDGSRWIQNITVLFHNRCCDKGVAAGYFIRKPCCGRLFHSKLPPNAQRSHVTRICSTILLTLSVVKASGDRPSTWCTLGVQMPGGDTEPPPRFDS